MTQFDYVAWLLIFGQLGLLLILIGPAARTLLRGTWVNSRAEWLQVGAIFFVAVITRFIVADPTFIHENHHAYTLVTTTDFLGYPNQGSVALNVAFIWILSWLPWPVDTPLLVINALLSSVAVIGLWALAKLAFSSRLAAWVTGCVVALQPLSIMMGPTEEFLVTGSGFLFIGLPLLWVGFERDELLLLITGVVCVSLGGSARDIATPLLCLPIFVVLALPKRPPIMRIAGCFAALGALNLPRMIGIVEGFGELPSSFLTFDLFLTLPHTTALREPYIPVWTTALAGLGSIVLLARTVRGHWRVACIALGPFLVAQVVSSFMLGGYITSALRHQLLAMALMSLPIGWLAQWLASFHKGIGLGLYLLVPLACLVQLGFTPPRWEVPAISEYQFFRDAIRSQPKTAQLVALPTVKGRMRISPRWVLEQQPNWTLASNEDVPLGAFLVLDRSCFHCAPSSDCGEMVSSPFGRMDPSCSRVYKAARWEPVATLEIKRDKRSTIPMNPVDSVVQIGLLKRVD